jgi:AAA domain
VPGETPVLILTGPPGAGKTTTAAALVARSPRAAHLESDRFFQFIRDRRDCHPGWFLEPVRDVLRDAGHPVALAVLRAPLPVNVLELPDDDVEKVTMTLTRHLADDCLLV